MENKKGLKLAVTGALAGAVNGFFGGGGGMVLVPLLRGWIGLEDRRAFATSVAVMLPLCAVSAAAYMLRGGIDLAAAWPYLLGGLAGGVLSGVSYKRVPPKLLVRLFAALVIFGGLRSALG